MTHIEKTSRRQFIVTTAAFAGGMSLAVSSRAASAATPYSEAWAHPVEAGTKELSAWVAIGADDTVTIRVAMPEIGNGVMTQGAMTICEELQCDWSNVRVEHAPPLRDYLENGVYAKDGGDVPYFGGHSTNEVRTKTLLQAGASARERLKAAAAETWKVPVSEIGAAKSILTHVPTGRTLTYGQVAAKAATITLKSEPALKPQSEWTFLGKQSPSKLHLPQVVTGKAVYGIDVRVPGMVYAALRQAPVHGGKLRSYDAAAVMKFPGVRAIVTVDPSETKGTPVKLGSPFGTGFSEVQSGIAVIADHYWQAKMALDALPVEWDHGDGAKWASTEQVYDAALECLASAEGAKVEHEVGDVSKLDQYVTKVEATYLTPYCEQNTMEPLNGTALVTAASAEVWHPAQESKHAFWIVVDETGLPPEKVTFHQTFVGGGFGRRVFANDLRMVVAVARKYPDVPVQVIWSREETMRQGRYRPMVTARLTAGLGENKTPEALRGEYLSTGMAMQIGLNDSPYNVALIPNVRLEAHPLPMHLLTGPYRGPGYNSYSFIVETFIDECAAAAGVDPLEYRLKIFDNPKWPDPGWTACLKVAAEKAGWGKSLPKGWGQGIAIANWSGEGKPQHGTTVAAVATVEVSPQGVLRIHAIDVAFDCGRIMNADAVRTEIEGATIFGLNMTLNEELSIRDGQIVEGNYSEYPILRIGDVPPKINVHFEALSNHDRFGMIGEPPVGPVGPAVGNAIFKATGKRLRSTPFRKHDLSWV